VLATRARPSRGARRPPRASCGCWRWAPCGLRRGVRCLAFFTIYLRTELPLGLWQSAPAPPSSASARSSAVPCGLCGRPLRPAPRPPPESRPQGGGPRRPVVARGTGRVATLGFFLGIVDDGLWPTFGAASADLLPPSRRQGGLLCSAPRSVPPRATSPSLGVRPRFGTAAVGAALNEGHGHQGVAADHAVTGRARATALVTGTWEPASHTPQSA
jgi:hypothetical protein